MNIKETFIDITSGEGLYIHGFSDLTGLLGEKYAGYPFGISIGRRLDDEIIDGLQTDGPTVDYYGHYRRVNHELARVCGLLAERLTANGYECMIVRPTVEISELDEGYSETLSYSFSHKMAATRAGLGWIGKTDLFVSERFGPRLRLATVLIDRPPPLSSPPCIESRCGNCSVCVEACPAGAANGRLWNVRVHRDEFFDPFKCREKCRELSKRNFDVDISLCAICVSVCPIGKRKKSRK